MLLNPTKLAETGVFQQGPATQVGAHLEVLVDAVQPQSGHTKCPSAAMTLLRERGTTAWQAGWLWCPVAEMRSQQGLAAAMIQYRARSERRNATGLKTHLVEGHEGQAKKGQRVRQSLPELTKQATRGQHQKERRKEFF